jgi:hypothetical protein
VLVETTPIDGTFAVVESWKGDLRPGSQVVIPDQESEFHQLRL